ncbi:uncharacterized protein [Euwallacea fornicatus]|uniref:uncharacterized protein n=1 Tax=Euwallacea fornicatus TaxID=995702 RepID=UPI00338FDCE6
MKLFATFFLVFLAIHASTQTPVKDDSIKNIIVVVVDAILKRTDTLLTNSETRYENFKADPQGETDRIVDVLAQLEADSNDLFIKRIDELKDGASDEVVAAVECIDAEEEAVNAAAKETITTTATCVSKKYDSILNEVGHVLEELRTLQTDVQTQTDTLEKCSDDEIACLNGYITSMVQTTVKVIDAARKDVVDILAVVKEVVEQLESCDILPSIKANTLKIFDETLKCIKA